MPAFQSSISQAEMPPTFPDSVQRPGRYPSALHPPLGEPLIVVEVSRVSAWPEARGGSTVERPARFPLPTQTPCSAVKP